MSGMARKKKEKNRFIKSLPAVSTTISQSDIGLISQIDYPVFSFKYLQPCSIKDCKDSRFFYEFLMRMAKLSALGWKEIAVSDRHGFGMEKIERNAIKPEIPPFITPEVPIFAFRATGNNLPFVGIRCDKIFHIVFIETRFGDVYDHE